MGVGIRQRVDLAQAQVDSGLLLPGCIYVVTGVSEDSSLTQLKFYQPPFNKPSICKALSFS
jgi:hypothetical protein